MKNINYVLSWVLVRPRRWLFCKMCWGYHLQPWFERHEWDRSIIIWPNWHWWALYHTVFRFFNWLHWEAWRKLCEWGPVALERKPAVARIIQRIGQTTAGYASHGGECFHCASEHGCQVELASDETGTTFVLERAWQESSQEGTDHRFCGITICPKCGYRAQYEDGSL